MTDAPPERQEWPFRDPASGEQRKYVQRELTIDGEVALLGLVSKAVTRLNAKGFPWSDLRLMIQQADTKNPIQSIDWSLAQGVVIRALGEVPELGTEAAAILVGVVPGSKDYEDDLGFIRRSLKLMQLYDMIRLFMAQNDYARLTAPFNAAIARAIREAQQQAIAAEAA